MTNRIKITSNSASPFRVSAPGVDVTGATFDGLLFDGNQMPMRVYSTGYFSAAIRDYRIPGTAVMTPGPYGPSTPSGTYPLFTVISKTIFGGGYQNYPRTVGGGFAGATFNSSNQLQGLTFTTNAPDTTVSNLYINYLIFRNAG